MLSTKLLAVTVVVAFGLCFFAPVHYLVLFDLTLVRFLGEWSFSGIRFNPTDLILGFLAVAVVLRKRSALTSHKPYLFWWIVLGIFMCLSYVISGENARSMTNPVRVVYQLARYCWKPILYYPICLALLDTPKKVHQAFFASIVGASIMAIMVIQQGYSGQETVGPFTAKNAMGGFLVIPLILALSGLILPNTRTHWIFSGVTSVLLARALFFTGSRGAMVAAVGGMAILGGLLFLTRGGRKRILLLIPLAVLSVAALLVARPDLLDRPSVKHAMTVTEGSKTNTMQWRLQQRWPHFFRLALERPWFGWGTAVDDVTFGRSGNTPHNGFLTLAMIHGFVVPILYILFFFRLIRDCLWVFRRSRDMSDRVVAATLMAGTSGLMLHNMVDAMLTIDIFTKIFWMMCALAALHKVSLLHEQARARAAVADLERSPAAS